MNPLQSGVQFHPFPETALIKIMKDFYVSNNKFLGFIFLNFSIVFDRVDCFFLLETLAWPLGYHFLDSSPSTVLTFTHGFLMISPYLPDV